MNEASEYRTNPSLLGRLGTDPSNATAWTEFVRRYGGLIYRWCRVWDLQDADAQDVTQNILLRVARQMRTFRYDPKRRFRGWLRAVAHGAWCDWLTEQNRPDHATGDSAALHRLSAIAARDDLLHRLEAEYDCELLEFASAQVRLRVTPQSWEAFRLQAIEGLSGAETADRLAMNVGAVFVAKSRVHKLLQQAIRELEGGQKSADEPGV